MLLTSCWIKKLVSVCVSEKDRDERQKWWEQIGKQTFLRFFSSNQISNFFYETSFLSTMLKTNTKSFISFVQSWFSVCFTTWPLYEWTSPVLRANWEYLTCLFRWCSMRQQQCSCVSLNYTDSYCWGSAGSWSQPFFFHHEGHVFGSILEFLWIRHGSYCCHSSEVSDWSLGF